MTEEPVFGSGLYERLKKKQKKKKKPEKSYFLIVRLSQIMYFKSQKYTVGQLFVYYKNQHSEFIFKEIMQTR